MFLSRTVAKEIINELHPYINFDINIMDTDSIIIASTNSARENTLHEGSKKLLSEGLSVLSIETDTSYPGCKRGVNLPISYGGTIVGVVGISGAPSETFRYGYLLQKMTEMLIYENFDAIKKSAKERTDLLLILDLINGNFANSPLQIEERILNTSLKAEGPFRVFIIRLEQNAYTQKDDSDILKKNAVQNYIFRQLSSNRILFAYNNDHYIAVTNMPLDKLHILLDNMLCVLNSHFEKKSVFTIGNEYDDYFGIPKSYNEANLTFNHLSAETFGIFEYNIVSLELLLGQIPTAYKKVLLDLVFKDFDAFSINETCDFINSYFKCSGSIKTLSEEQFVHKNTIQYRIDRIKRQTTLDMRKSHDLFILYMAALFSKDSLV